MDLFKMFEVVAVGIKAVLLGLVLRSEVNKVGFFIEGFIQDLTSSPHAPVGLAPIFPFLYLLCLNK